MGGINTAAVAAKCVAATPLPVRICTSRMDTGLYSSHAIHAEAESSLVKALSRSPGHIIIFHLQFVSYKPPCGKGY